VTTRSFFIFLLVWAFVLFALSLAVFFGGLLEQPWGIVALAGAAATVLGAWLRRRYNKILGSALATRNAETEDGQGKPVVLWRGSQRRTMIEAVVTLAIIFAAVAAEESTAVILIIFALCLAVSAVIEFGHMRRWLRANRRTS